MTTVADLTSADGAAWTSWKRGAWGPSLFASGFPLWAVSWKLNLNPGGARAWKLRSRRMPLDNRSQNLRVLVADDHPVFREGLRMLLETDPKIRVVGEASDGSEAAAMASELKPHLVLMDMRMPRCSGLEALRIFQKMSLPVRILILATEVRKQEIVEALRYGASGIVLKETATQLLRKSIS